MGPVSGEAHEEERRRRSFQYESERPDVQAVVPHSARRILDLGCASGALGAALKARQKAEVVGIELDPGYARDARARLDHVVEADIEELIEGDEFRSLGDFDCVIAADVLEHLRDPWVVMRRATPLLRPGGSAIVSLPNIRFWETFWQVGYRSTWPRRASYLRSMPYMGNTISGTRKLPPARCLPRPAG